MNRNRFFKTLTFVALGLIPLLFLLSYIPDLQAHQIFIWINWAFFLLFTIGVYFLAEKAANDPNLNTFSRVIMGVIFVKMILILIVVLIYKKTMNPEGAWFLLPFFIIYLVFTIFEVYFMNKLGRIKPPKSGSSEVQSSGQ